MIPGGSQSLPLRSADLVAGLPGNAAGMLAALDVLRAVLVAMGRGQPPSQPSPALAALAAGTLPTPQASRAVALGAQLLVRQEPASSRKQQNR